MCICKRKPPLLYETSNTQKDTELFPPKHLSLTYTHSCFLLTSHTHTHTHTHTHSDTHTHTHPFPLPPHPHPAAPRPLGAAPRPGHRAGRSAHLCSGATVSWRPGPACGAAATTPGTPPHLCPTCPASPAPHRHQAGARCRPPRRRFRGRRPRPPGGLALSAHRTLGACKP